MKIKLEYIVLALLALSVFAACKSTTGLSKEQVIENIDSKMQERDFTFAATRANPMSGRSIHLTPTYSLVVKPDSIIAYLPFFGRAYAAPMPYGADGGIKFTSTDFEYKVSEKKKGIYTIAIEIKDNPNNYRLSLLVGETGSGTLHVNQRDKQSISFHGNIE